MRKTVGCLAEPEVPFSVFLGTPGIQGNEKENNVQFAEIITFHLSGFKKICSLELPFGTLSSGYLSYYFKKKEKIFGAVCPLAP